MWSTDKTKLQEQFEEKQRESIKQMFNPSLWTKIKFNFWKLYWKVFIPDNIYTKTKAITTYCVDDRRGDFRKSISLEGMSSKERRLLIKNFIKQDGYVYKS